MNKFIDKLRIIFKNKDIRNKVIFTFVILLVYRFMAGIPVVGIPKDALEKLFSGIGLGDVISTVSGGVLQQASIIAIGLGPYINSSVIFQLLGTVIPKLEELRQQGTEGRRIISMYTRWLTLPMAVFQSFVIYVTLRGFGLVGDLRTLELAAMIASLTAGALFMMWLGELISESGLGGGSSTIIFFGILSALPGRVISNYRFMDWVELSIMIGFTIFILGLTLYIDNAERRIKIIHSRRVKEGLVANNYIPLKLTQFGVMPVIFAISLLSFPEFIAKFIQSRQLGGRWDAIAVGINNFMQNALYQNMLIFFLVVGFALFYLTVVFNTDEFAENLQKQGAFIPRVRPGKSTSLYIRSISTKLSIVGAIFLGVLAILPNVLVSIGLWQQVLFSGTGLLILVSVVTTFKREIDSLVVLRSYDKYL